jgi:hypothetical protein
MYEVPIRFSSDSASDRYISSVFGGRLRTGRSLIRDRSRKPRRYLLYAGLLVGFCILLAFAGCGVNTPVGELAATQSNFTFGAVAVGQTSTTTVSFLNTGQGAVQITQVNVSGQPFKLANAGNLPAMVAVGATYNVQVQFKPSSAGEATGQVTLMSTVNTGGLPTATVSGLGVQTVSFLSTAAGVLRGISCRDSSIARAGTDHCLVALNAPAGSAGETLAIP